MEGATKAWDDRGGVRNRRPRCVEARPGPFTAYASLGFLALLIWLPSSRPGQPPTVAHAATSLHLSGKVCDQGSGKPIPHATVAVGPVRAEADAKGTYGLDVAPAVHYFTQASAPGYQSSDLIVISSRQDMPLSGNGSFSFCGQSGLVGAFRTTDGSVKLRAFPLLLRAGAASLTLTGASEAALEDDAALLRPDGTVSLIPIVRAGGSIRIPLNLHEDSGRYVLEINADAGFALLKVPFCVGAYLPPPAPPDYAGDPPGASIDGLRADVIQQINRQRAQAHLPAIRPDQRLMRAAQAHSDDIVAGGYLLRHAHVGSDRSTPGDRVRAAGVGYEEVGEDVGSGDSVQEIILGLMDSPGHRWAILGDFAHLGVGLARQGATLVVTADFVR